MHIIYTTLNWIIIVLSNVMPSELLPVIPKEQSLKKIISIFIFFHEIAFENVICKMLEFLFRLECVKSFDHYL